MDIKYGKMCNRVARWGKTKIKQRKKKKNPIKKNVTSTNTNLLVYK